ncbi:MAG: EamA family transporter RarD [Desulforhopalus sp.]
MSEYYGLIAGTLCFVIWGLLPIYWKWLQAVPAYEIICHRMVWSLILTLGLVFILRRQKMFWQGICNRSNLLIYTVSAVLLAMNWLLYIWAVNADYIVETSLGYFINPLINVFFGMLFFKETMRPVQWFALFLAVLGVLYLTFYYGQFPWIALTLAICFGTYGLIHKKHPLGALDGLCLETTILFLPALIFLLGVEVVKGGAFGHIGMKGSLMLAGTGVVTTVPLLLFAYAAKKINLSTVGFLQYLAPTMNLIIGVYLYKEPFPIDRLVGFVLIWGALVLFLGENLWRRYRQKTRLGGRVTVGR